MTELKCPFCGQELKAIYCGGLYVGLACKNVGCLETKDFLGSEALWQELIRTRKALDVAMDWLEQVATPAKCDDDLCREFTKRKLAEIKTITEKDK